MNGKDLFDAISGVKDEYLDEVTAEIVRDSEQLHEGVNHTKSTGGSIGHVLPWAAVIVLIVGLLAVATAMHLRNRKPNDPGQTPMNGVTATGVPTETVTTAPTSTVTEPPIPDEEINSIGVRNRQLVCGWNFAADIQADGTVRITTLPGLERIAELHLYKPRVDMWKDIVSLRSGFEMLYAVDRNGLLRAESELQDYIRSQSGEQLSDTETVSNATWIAALPEVENFIDGNKLVDGEYLSPMRSGRNLFLKEDGEFVELVFEGSHIPTIRTVDDHVVSFEGHFYLREDGTVGTFLDPKDLSGGRNGILKETDICELAENAIGVFGLRKNGTVACCVEPRYSCGEIVGSWRGVRGIAAEGSTGASCVAVIAAVHTDGTVSAVGVRETGSKEIEEVKSWKNVVAVAVGYNGRFIAGKTADGEILFAVLESDPVREELEASSPYDLYRKSMAVANPEQKAKLEAIQDDLYFGDWEEAYTRKILTIMGVMPEDAPYLTVEDAKRLIEEMKAEGILDDFYSNAYLVRDRFNTVATAPDMDGGSGFTIIKYAVDADHVKYIEIHSGGGIRYYDGTEDTWLYKPEYGTEPAAPVVYQPETGSISISELRASCPEYFELDASNGLTVMVASFAEGNYQCTLHAGYIDELSLSVEEINRIYTEKKIFNISTMKAILQTYHLPEEKIHIAAVQSAWSSYLYNVDEEYRAKLQELFFGNTRVLTMVAYSGTPYRIGYSDLKGAMAPLLELAENRMVYLAYEPGSGSEDILPAFRLDSTEEYNAFVAAASECHMVTDRLEQVVGGFEFDEEFYKDNSLLIAIVYSGSSTWQFGLDNITVIDTIANMHVCRTDNFEAGNDAEAGWYIIVVMPKKDLEGVTSITAAYRGK